MSFDPSQLTPGTQGVQAPATISITASSAVAKMDSWSVDILAPDGKTFRSFAGKWPTTTATWDGTSTTGMPVAPSTTYNAVATVQDEFGLSAELKDTVAVAAIPNAPQETMVQPRLSGFSPVSATMARSIDLLVSIGNQSAIKSWKLELLQSELGEEKQWSGDASSVPSVITWDGTADAGGLAPEGKYMAVLDVDYGVAFQPVQVKSSSFILDVSPPTGTLSVSPSALTPNGSGGIEPESIGVDASSKVASIQSWSLSVVGPASTPVATFSGLDPTARVPWDGTMTGGGEVDPTKSYALQAKIQDVYGNVGLVQVELPGGALPEVTGTVAATTKLVGFSPTADSLPQAETILLSLGEDSAVTGWTVSIAQAGMSAVRTFEGDGTSIPVSVDWNGKADDGTMAPEGTYVATLNVSYGTSFRAASAVSAPFVLDTTAPTGEIALSAPLFSPMEGVNTLTMTVNASSPVAKIDSWSMDIQDPGGNLFDTFHGTWPDHSVVWDGKGSNGDLVQSAEDYPVVARIRDQFGNVGEAKATVPIDILVEKTATGYRILASRIFFKDFTADYTDVAPDLAKQNVERLDALAAKLKKFPDYKIKLVGHAVSIFWWDPPLKEQEQKDILMPLSMARAEAIKQALVERGINGEDLLTDGVGASDQLVPDSDLAERWQNRRVALFIEKTG